MEYSHLSELLHACTVKVISADGKHLGTGFFAAPGMVITCAHVIEHNGNRPIALRWKKSVVSAKKATTLQYTVIDQEQVEWPDLALLETDFKDHPCVLLLPDAEIGHDLYTFGYTKEYPNGEPTTAVLRGRVVRSKPD